MSAKALYRGPAHVIVAVDEEVARLSGFDVVGLPIREAYPHPEFVEAHLIMDAVYRDGVPRSLPCPSTEGVEGVVMVWPVRVDGRLWGVATDWRSGVGQPTPERPMASPVLQG